MVAAGSTTRFILDGVQVVEEYDGSGAWQARYLYEDGIDRPRAMDRADVADVNGNANTTEVLRFHYHSQALGAVTEITQPTGAVVEWVTYDVYGAATIRDRLGATVASSAVGNPWLFTGRVFDAESGLYHYRARAYDASAGQFLQRDPLEFVDGLGLHGYAGCSPSVYVDPRGTRELHGSSLQDEDSTKARDDEVARVAAYERRQAEEEEQRQQEEKALADAVELVAEHGPEWAQDALEMIEGDVEAVDADELEDPEANGETLFPPKVLLWLLDPSVRISRERRCRGRSKKDRRLLVRTLLHELLHVHFTFHDSGNYANVDHSLPVTLPNGDGTTTTYPNHYFADTDATEKTLAAAAGPSGTSSSGSDPKRSAK